MKILVVGAGVLGSLYAARLQKSGNDVTVLARGDRLEEIRQDGLLLEDFMTRERTVTSVKTIPALEADDPYDWGIILVRKEQLATVLPFLKENKNIPNLLFMVNNPAGSDFLNNTLGSERVIDGLSGRGRREVRIRRAIPVNPGLVTIDNRWGSKR